ncbi:coiled-coil domain-containing protein 150 isoform X3 [Epinephelus fuscoguttatus]|uniref:coiled-coil domain-containing protein 150 isoform X3 n=1 Tax=Epinephelus fuscoguttatus TaxID=293821 RepID=UPI0020D06FF7|nr:coiled-coil domain-containing protein 150 isoform X3 [Epinephelus fuscoguttatus]
MSRPAIPPLSVGATAPEALSLLHQRLLMAEEEAESLIRDMGTLGVSRDQILGSAQRMDATQRPVSPLKVRRVSGDEGALWRQCDALVSRVCRMESLLQTLKLTVFRLETERQLDPSHTAHLEQQLAALQQDSEEERQACRREVMKLREQLHQAYQERDEALTEVQRLEETVGAAAAAKMEVALAAEELKIVKLEMSQKLTEMQQQMRQESARSAEAMKSHSEFLQRVEEMERAVEMERRQALMLRSDCQALRVEVRTGRQQLAEEEDRVRQLEERCQQLTEQTVMKDSLVSELRTELKAERSRAVHQLQQQDLQLEAATRSIQTELQVALTDKVNLQLELQKLTGEHAQLLQSSSTARETASTQRELLERTIERLRGELSTARREEGAVRKDLQSLKNKQEAGSLSSALQRQQDENRRLMGKVAASEQQQQVHQMLKDLTASEKGNLKVSELEALQCVCGPAGGAVSQTLASQTLQQELSTLKTHRVQAQREIRNHQAEVEKLQRLLTSTHAKNNRALESLQKASDSAKVDNKKLAQSLEQAVLTNSSLRSKLEQTRDQYQAAITLRDEELREARTQISHLSEELGALKQQTRGDYESSMKTLHREISELKHTVKASAARSGDLSKANQELHQRVSELERLVSKQKACIREHRSRLRQQHMSRDLQDNCQEDERFEERTRNLHEEEQADHKPQEVRMDSQQVLHKREAEWERWTSTIQRWEAKRELAHIAGGSTPVRTQLTKQSH